MQAASWVVQEGPWLWKATQVTQPIEVSFALEHLAAPASPAVKQTAKPQPMSAVYLVRAVEDPAALQVVRQVSALVAPKSPVEQPLTQLASSPQWVPL